MVIHNLDIFCACNRPPKADPKLLVHADAMLPDAVALKRFEPVARWDTEIFKTSRNLQLSKLAPRNRLYIHESWHAPAVCEGLRVGTSERYDHNTLLTHRVMSVKHDAAQPGS
jgi:hypothetical protein